MGQLGHQNPFLLHLEEAAPCQQGSLGQGRIIYKWDLGVVTQWVPGVCSGLIVRVGETGKGMN